MTKARAAYLSYGHGRYPASLSNPRPGIIAAPQRIIPRSHGVPARYRRPGAWSW